jgi:hypothetical protein
VIRIEPAGPSLKAETYRIRPDSPGSPRSFLVQQNFFCPFPAPAFIHAIIDRNYASRTLRNVSYKNTNNIIKNCTHGQDGIRHIAAMDCTFTGNTLQSSRYGIAANDYTPAGPDAGNVIVNKTMNRNALDQIHIVHSSYNILSTNRVSDTKMNKTGQGEE